GTAARTRTTQLVADVHAFPGHIACDSRSASEIVVPVFDRAGRLIAVFDVDSAAEAAFDETDQRGLEAILREVFARGAPGARRAPRRPTGLALRVLVGNERREEQGGHAMSGRIYAITGAFGALGSAVARAAAAQGARLALIDFAKNPPAGLPSGDDVL